MAGRPRPNVREFTPLPKERSPLVSVIVPARNEAANIRRCLRSLVASQYPNLEVIVVDDRSTDDTWKIATRCSTEDPRIRVIRGIELPKDWYGKPWACWQGYQQARGDVLLFTDADTVHGLKLLPHAVAALVESRVDLVSVMPRQEMTTFWERVVQPFFFLILGLRFGSLARINRNRNPRHGIANGQFILVTRDSYEWVGGHRKLKDTVIEDLMLGVHYLEGNRSHLFALADQDMTTRMYSSLAGIIEGWSKNFFIGALQTMRSMPLAYLGILGSLMLPAFFVMPSVVLGLGIALHDHVLTGFGGAAYGAASLMIGLILHGSKAPLLFGLLHPLGALTQACIILRAAWRGRRRIEWKGRTYSQA